MAKAVAALANSPGCKVAEPMAYHDVAPFMVFPKKRTPTNKSSAMIYMTLEKRS